jgi:A/G-specific adenine glycosylase
MTVAGERRRKKQADDAPAGVRGPDPAALLAWYDRHRRVLPWRAPPGVRADPYRVWLSEIMLQQTTVRAVAPYYQAFLQRFPTVERLAGAPLDEVLKAWAGLGYYARARYLHACARAVVERHGGHFPNSEDALRALPGIGAYTAAAIAAIAFDRQASPVDGNIERVIARLYAVETPLPAAKPEIRQLAQALTPSHRLGDFAQAMMDLGATICTPKQPACILCPWADACVGRRRGDAELFPRKAAKQEGRLRRGAAFVVVRADGFVLVRSRPENGLLGGMTEVPGTVWSHDFDLDAAREEAEQLIPLATKGRGGKSRWRRIPGIVTHTFTHFPLELAVYTAAIPSDTPAPEGMRWLPVAEIGSEAFPTLMRKVLAHADTALVTRLW